MLMSGVLSEPAAPRSLAHCVLFVVVTAESAADLVIMVLNGKLKKIDY